MPARDRDEALGYCRQGLGEDLRRQQAGVLAEADEETAVQELLGQLQQPILVGRGLVRRLIRGQDRRGRRVIAAQLVEEVQAQVPVEDIEGLGDALLFAIRPTGQTFDRALSGGIGPEQGAPGEEEQKIAQPVWVGQIGEEEALAVTLAPVGAVEA